MDWLRLHFAGVITAEDDDGLVFACDKIRDDGAEASLVEDLVVFLFALHVIEFIAFFFLHNLFLGLVSVGGVYTHSSRRQVSSFHFALGY